jgi:hypothetical protein
MATNDVSMAKMLRRIIEIALVIGIAFVTSELLYMSWVRANMSEAVKVIVAMLLAPATILGYLFGGVHSAGRGYFTTGLVIQFLIIWSIARLFIWVFTKGKRNE